MCWASRGTHWFLAFSGASLRVTARGAPQFSRKCTQICLKCVASRWPMGRKEWFSTSMADGSRYAICSPCMFAFNHLCWCRSCWMSSSGKGRKGGASSTSTGTPATVRVSFLARTLCLQLSINRCILYRREWRPLAGNFSPGETQRMQPASPP